MKAEVFKMLWAAKQTSTGVEFFQCDDPVPDGATRTGAAIYREAGIPYKYLKIQDGSVMAMDANEIAAVDAAEAQAQADADAEQAAIEAAQQAAEAEYKAEQEHAFLLAVERVTPLADQYRSLLRKYFGEGAELNHEITRESVLGYFALLTGSGAITAQQVADAALIQTLFAVLAPLATDRAYSAENKWSADFWRLIA